ncbi:HAD family phosphatase [Mesorhizobium sp. LHD-90]|uniref:HAD family hydrolase n=1 Tax=Mesorhizobium sp. LHD-90 TaxID=3071414 RepID=UPI0027E0BD15|nr:HAD family phosphatase [Mesorhizobium sp. LHD-90]MDQ6435484.1 HAD family phosphatase [Mesorhizobium sp. LHD-90]
MNQRPKALVFDMDGLLLDTEGVYKRSWTVAAAGLGFDLTDALFQRLIGITIADCEKRLVEHFGPDFPLERFRGDARTGYEDIILTEGIPLKPGVHAILDWAREAGIPCGIGTSTATEEARSRLIHHGIQDRFSVVVGGDQVSHGKPDPEIFLKVAQGLGQGPEHCLVFEDAHSGVRAARAGGMSVVLVPDLLPATDEIAAMTSGVFPSLNATVDWLKTLPERSS